MNAQFDQFAQFANRTQEDRDLYEWKSERTFCDFHRANPDVSFIVGCGCSVRGFRVPRPAEDAERIRAARVREMEDRILADAERIKARRAREGAA